LAHSDRLVQVRRLWWSAYTDANSNRNADGNTNADTHADAHSDADTSSERAEQFDGDGCLVNSNQPELD
jgi:hypothetical protein